jgi:hypothetical protein
MDQAIATGIIAAASVLLGVVVGRVLESRSETRTWWRGQRRDAYAGLLVSEQRFQHLIVTESTASARAGWLAVQEAAALVDLVAPDEVAEAAKQFVARSRRYWEALGAQATEGTIEAGLQRIQDRDDALAERIRWRRTFVEVAKTDLLSRRTWGRLQRFGAITGPRPSSVGTGTEQT